VFDLAVKHIAKKRASGAKVLVTGWSAGSLDRLLQVLEERGLERVKHIESFAELDKLKKGEAAAAVLSLEGGFETDGIVVIGEQDILGDRMVRRGKRRKRGADFISEISGLDEGSLVVHAEHGIGRFVGLVTIEAAGHRAPASSCITLTMPSSSCRWKTSTFCRVTGRMPPRQRSTSSAAVPGRRGRPSSRSGFSTWRMV
jgi:transcription-repair coupling factor (superfamily II helicase)